MAKEIGQVIYQYFSRALTSGEIITIYAYARFITLLGNTASTAIKISFNGQPFQSLPAGLSVELPPADKFQYLQFQNVSGATCTITFSLSSGRIYDNRLISTADLGVADIANQITTPAAIVLNAGNSYTQTIAADTTQKGLIIQNTGANDCWYGKDGASIDPATKRGIKLAVGDKDCLPITCALTFESASVDCTISYMRLQKV